MRVIEQIREWLSIELISLGIKLIPYEEMRELVKAGVTLGIESYLQEDADDSEDYTDWR